MLLREQSFKVDIIINFTLDTISQSNFPVISDHCFQLF